MEVKNIKEKDDIIEVINSLNEKKLETSGLNVNYWIEKFKELPSMDCKQKREVVHQHLPKDLKHKITMNESMGSINDFVPGFVRICYEELEGIKSLLKAVVNSGLSDEAFEKLIKELKFIQEFTNRKKELEDILKEDDLAFAKNPYPFFFISGLPRIGKGFFIEELVRRLKNDNTQWNICPLDTQKKPDLVDDAGAILRSFFSDSLGRSSINRKAYSKVFDAINNRPTLCILYSAECLETEVVIELRQFLRRVINYKKVNNYKKPKLGFLVVGRCTKQRDVWENVPEEEDDEDEEQKQAIFEIVELTPFKEDDVKKMLEENGLKPQLENGLLLSKNLYSFSEGLPALLKCCIDWCKHEDNHNQPLQIEDLEKSEVLRNYVEKHILSNENLYPKSEFRDPVKKTRATQLIKDILLELTPFRSLKLQKTWFNETLKQAAKHKYLYYKAELSALNWNEGKLFEAIKNSYLIKQTDGKDGFTIHKSIRRILFRYHFTQEKQLEAHTKAANIYDKVLPQVPNLERIGFVLEIEAFWHNIERFRLLQRNSTLDGVLDEKGLFEFIANWKEKIIEKYKDSFKDKDKDKNKNEDEDNIASDITSSLRASIENENDSEIMQSLNALKNSLGSKVLSEIHSS